MKKYVLKKLTKEEAIDIINKDERLKEEYAIYKEHYDKRMLDVGFTYGNFFNIDDGNKIAIQWGQYKNRPSKNGNDCEEEPRWACEIVVDSLEEAIVIVDEIEYSHAYIDLDNSGIDIKYFEEV